MTQFYPAQSIMDTWPDTQPEFVLVHHSAGNPNQTKEELRDWFIVGRKSEGYSWIGYNAVIWPDGTIVQTRPFNKRGGHCPSNDMNSKSIGICFMGNYSNMLPTATAWASFQKLLSEIYRDFDINPNKVITHRDIKATLCPGDALYAELKNHVHVPPAPTEYPKEVEPCTCDLSKFTPEELVDELSARIKSK